MLWRDTWSFMRATVANIIGFHMLLSFTAAALGPFSPGYLHDPTGAYF